MFENDALTRSFVGKDALMSGKAPRTGAKLGALLDKTPFPNRTANVGTTNSKDPFHKSALPLPKSKLVFTTSAPSAADISAIEDEATSPLPSSTRRSLKLPSSATKLFDVTPPSRIMGNGGGWDISDGSIDIGSPLLEPTPFIEEEPDELEYMPPSAIGMMSFASLETHEC